MKTKDHSKQLREEVLEDRYQRFAKVENMNFFTLLLVSLSHYLDFEMGVCLLQVQSW